MSRRLIPPAAQGELATPIPPRFWDRACDGDAERAAVAAALEDPPTAFWVERALLPQAEQPVQLAFGGAFASALARGAEVWEAVWKAAFAVAQAREADQLSDEGDLMLPTITFDARNYEEVLGDLLALNAREVTVRLEAGGTGVQAVSLEADGVLRGTPDVSDLAGQPGLAGVYERMTQSPSFYLEGGARFAVPKQEFSHATRERGLNLYSLTSHQSLGIVTNPGAVLWVDDATSEPSPSGPSIERALAEGWR
jgi:hypothetical protein